MDALTAVVEVPLEDAAALSELHSQLSVSTPIVESEALDGETVLQALVAVTLASLPVLKAWLLARADRAKSTVVSWKGRRFVGYSAKDVAAIAKALEQSLGEGKGEAPADPK